MSSLLDYANTYHAYVFGTSFWYFLRGIARVIDPAAVCGWFRPPSQWAGEPNDLELYTTRTDAYGLLALAALLLLLADAVPFPGAVTGSALADSGVKKPFARGVIVITMLHHVATGLGAYTHWAKPSHHTIAMDIGVYGNIGLVALGFLALTYGLNGRVESATVGKKRV